MDDTLLQARLRLIEEAAGPVKTLPNHYLAGERVQSHSHSRAQLLYAREGVVIVSSDQGRWMVPPEHALWIPPRVTHSVEMLANVKMLSLYLAADALPRLPDTVRVVGVTALARELIIAAVEPDADNDVPGRRDLLMPLLLDVLASLPERALALPFPRDPALATLCRRFIAAPSPDLTIEAWAGEMRMSRRSFTRLFQRETGLSLSVWRQQACLFAALPKLAAGERVTTVALDLGYDSVAAFTTMFRRVLGSPPRAYLSSKRATQEITPPNKAPARRAQPDSR